MSEETALARAEQLRRALAGTLVKFGGAEISITASFGVAEFPRDGRNEEALIAAADRALYGAKAAGRNQVKTFTSLSADEYDANGSAASGAVARNTASLV